MEDHISHGLLRDHGLLQRELGSPRQRRLGFPESAAKKLSIEAILRGHRGCVNRLAWNEGGTLLASGSDDRQILVWHYPDTQQPPLRVETQHQANIFGVKFLPLNDDRRLVSGAMDYTVQLHTLDRSPAAVPAAVGAHGAGRPGAAATTVYTCHRGRVKCVEVEPGNPFLFWSAGEDGTVRQFDSRMSVASQRDYSSPNVLLALRGKAGRFLELKSLALSRVRPHQVAVGAGDPYVRIYDRRMASTGPPRGPGSPQVEPILKLAPPHLCLGSATARSPSRMHTTCVAFGNRGDKVVATYHSDHVYTFDISGAGTPTPQALSTPSVTAPGPSTASSSSQGPALPPELRLDFFGVGSGQLAAYRGTVAGGGGLGNGQREEGGSGTGGGGQPAMLPAAAEAAKAEGNLHFFNGQFSPAIQHYSRAIQLAPWSPVLYTNRALALIQRGLEGDATVALRDCEAAIELEPGSMKAHYRRVQALAACKLLKSAAAAARIFRRQFPEDAGEELGRLEDSVAAELAQRAQREERERAQRENRRQARRRQGLNLERRISQPGPQQAQRGPPRGAPAPAGPSAAAPPAAAAAASVGGLEGPAAGELQRGEQPGAVEAGAGGEAAAAAAAGGGEVEGGGGNEGRGGGGSHMELDSLATSSLAATSSDSGATEASSTSQEQAEVVEFEIEVPMAPALAAAGGRAGPLASRQQAQQTQQDQAASPSAVGREPPGDPGAALGTASREGGGQAERQAAPTSPPQASAAQREGPPPAAASPPAPAGPVRGRRSPESESEVDWIDLWGGLSSDEEEEGAEGGSSGLAAVVDVDQQYADALERAYQAAARKQQPSSSNGFIGPHPPPAPSLPQPSLWGAFEGGRRFIQRYIGQCNVQTDIKEATFLGPHDELVGCGSDDGHVFIFNAASGECVRVLRADDDVANCVQCHPHLPVLATSGIDHNIKVWSPEGPPTSGGNLAEIIQMTQDRMREGPTVLRGIDPALLTALTGNPNLLRDLLQRATRLGGGRGREEGGGQAGGDYEASGQQQQEEEEDGSDGDEAGRGPSVTCRMA